MQRLARSQNSYIAGLRAFGINVVGISVARGTEYQLAGSACSLWMAAALSGVSIRVSMRRPTRLISRTNVPRPDSMR